MFMVRLLNYDDMAIEAQDFYGRTKDLNPTFWFLDVEEESMKDMRRGVKAYVNRFRELGAKKVGVYIAHHLYEKFNLDLSDFDAIWIPRYGTNNGTPQVKPTFPCNLWQYTSVGCLPGYSGNLDLNIIISDKPLSFFTGEEKEKPKEQPMKEIKTYKVVTTLNGYYTASDAKNRKNAKGNVKPGEYFIFNESQGMINVTKKQGVPGSWINPNDNKKNFKSNQHKETYYTVKKGNYLIKIAKNHGVTLNQILKLNPQIKNPNLIYPGQKIRVK